LCGGRDNSIALGVGTSEVGDCGGMTEEKGQQLNMLDCGTNQN